MNSVKYAVITGGSKGLGFAMAKRLALKEGYTPILIARSEDSLNTAVARLRDYGINAHAFSADISDIASLKSAVEKIKEQFKSVDFLINNACTFHVGTLSELSLDDIKSDIDVGLVGSMMCTRSFLPVLNDRGRVLFISSGFGIMGPAGYSSYSAAKAGIINFADSVRREVYKKKIGVYVALPSDIDTPGLREETKNMPAWMNLSRARGKAMPTDMAAVKILAKCKGGRFLIFSDPMVYSLYLMSKVFPVFLRNAIIDMLFPRP